MTRWQRRREGIVSSPGFRSAGYTDTLTGTHTHTTHSQSQREVQGRQHRHGHRHSDTQSDTQNTATGHSHIHNHRHGAQTRQTQADTEHRTEHAGRSGPGGAGRYSRRLAGPPEARARWAAAYWALTLARCAACRSIADVDRNADGAGVLPAARPGQVRAASDGGVLCRVMSAGRTDTASEKTRANIMLFYVINSILRLAYE